MVEHGFTPKTTSERVDAYRSTKEAIWDDVSAMRKQAGEQDITFNAQTLADEIDKEINNYTIK